MKYLFLLAVLLCEASEIQEITRKSYNESAMAYAEKTASLFEEEEMGRFLADIPEFGLILDLGCGAGRDARIFSGMDYEVVGLDFSSELLALAKEAAPKAQFIERELEDLSLFQEGSFDGVWANASLHHVPKDEMPAILEQIHRILSPKGVFYISIKKGSGEGLEADKRYGGIEKYWAYYSEEEIVELHEKSGFEVLNFGCNGIQSAYQTHPFLKILSGKK